MVMSKGAVLDLAHSYFPSARSSFAQAAYLDYWGKGKQSGHESGKLFVPNRGQRADSEYLDLVDRSYTPWLTLVITAMVQTMFVKGIQIPGQNAGSPAAVQQCWMRNDMPAKQISLYRDQFTHGTAFGVSLPGRDPLTGSPMPVLRMVSARRMAAFDMPGQPSDYPMFTIEADRFWDARERGWTVELMDENAVHHIYCKGDGEDRKDWFYLDYVAHDTGVTPVARYYNMIDLDGDAVSEIEPLIPMAKRIDQDVFDRLIVQRFGAWKVRYITGLVKPAEVSDEDHVQTLLKLKVGDFLALEGKDSKVGTIDETQLDGFIAAHDADIRDLSAVSQTPPHHMLGLASNMQPESLAAVNANLVNKSFERKVGTEVSHRRLLRCAAIQMGNQREAEAYDMQFTWKDTETRSFQQAAQALGVVATQLGVPVEMLWRRLPDWTEFDSEEAKRIVESGAFDELVKGLAGQGLDVGTGEPAKV